MIMLISVSIAALNHYLGTIGKGIKWLQEMSFHYICPICGVSSIYQFIVSSSLWVDKLKSTLGIIIGIVIILSVLFGPVICGFFCPFGAIQDLIAAIGRKIFKDKYNTVISDKLNSKLKYLRYVSLVITIILTGISGGVMILEKINPYHAYLSIFNGRYSILGSIVLGFVIVTGIIIHRPWCRFLCPYGALLGLSNKIKVFRIVRKNDTCISCKKCSRSCPVGINIHEGEEIRNISCISCMECIDKKVCPKKGAILCTSEDFEEVPVKKICDEETLKCGEDIKLIK